MAEAAPPGAGGGEDVPSDGRGGEDVPSQVEIGGYFRWSWVLFRQSPGGLVLAFIGGVLLVRLAQLGLGAALTAGGGSGGSVRSLAVFLAFGVVASAVVGSVLSGLASVVFLARRGGTRWGVGDAWRRLRPRARHVVTSALYAAMPVLVLWLLFGPIVQLVVLPVLLGPPVLVQAVGWERTEFRDATTRAKALLSGLWSHVIIYLFAVALVAGVLQIVFLTGASRVYETFAGGGIDESVALVGTELLSSAVVWLFAAAASTVAYLDVRSRHEEVDASVLAGETKG